MKVHNGTFGTSQTTEQPDNRANIVVIFGRYCDPKTSEKERTAGRLLLHRLSYCLAFEEGVALFISRYRCVMGSLMSIP